MGIIGKDPKPIEPSLSAIHGVYGATQEATGRCPLNE
jgi:hypothetical protein